MSNWVRVSLEFAASLLCVWCTLGVLRGIFAFVSIVATAATGEEVTVFQEQTMLLIYGIHLLGLIGSLILLSLAWSLRLVAAQADQKK